MTANIIIMNKMANGNIIAVKALPVVICWSVLRPTTSRYIVQKNVMRLTNGIHPRSMVGVEA